MDAPVLPTKTQAEQAYAFMLDQIHVPAFFEKLAGHGIKPKNSTETEQLLQLGAVLAHAESQGQIKKAESSGEGNPFLAHLLDKYSAQPSLDNTDESIRQNADALIKANDLAKTAALIYGHVITGGELAADEPKGDEPKGKEDAPADKS